MMLTQNQRRLKAYEARQAAAAARVQAELIEDPAERAAALAEAARLREEAMRETDAAEQAF